MQGYLQLAMAKDNIKKTTFRAGSLGLYEFTHMPFGLSNAGLSFCRLMEQCLGDQQFVTLLLYLDDICIFAPDVSAMLDQIENQVTDALSQCPEPNCKLESNSDSNSDDPVMLSYATICDIIKPVLGDTKI